MNPLVTNAPFDAQEYNFGKINAVIPKDWSSSIRGQKGNNIVVALYPSTADLTVGTSSITVTVQEVATAPTYDIAKEYFTSILTLDFITNQLTTAGIKDVVVSDFKTSDYKSKTTTAFKTEYKVDFKTADLEVSCNQVIYDLYLNNYLVEVVITKGVDNVTSDIYQIAEYLLDTMKLVK